VRALSIQQPFIDAIVLGTKRVENRSWPAPEWIIGDEIALHASLKPDTEAVPPPGEDWPSHLIGSSRFGAILAVATIGGCHHASTTCGPRGMGLCSPWAVWHQWHWLTDAVRPLTVPVPCKGALKLWTLPDDVEAAVRAQLTAGSLR
jgi:hypothetical protein